MLRSPGENGDLIQSGPRLVPVLIAPQNHKVVTVFLQVESAGTADVSVLVIEQHRRLSGEQAVEPSDRMVRFNHQMPGASAVMVLIGLKSGANCGLWLAASRQR